MKVAIALCAYIVAMSCSSATEMNATHLKHENGKFVVAQSYCQMCRDARTSCILRCNGSGLCIHNCDDAFESCLEDNCRRFRRW